MSNHLCSNCKTGTLYKVCADEPWHVDYYICLSCDSTYDMSEIEEEDIDDEDQRGNEMSAYMNVNLRGN